MYTLVKCWSVLVIISNMVYSCLIFFVKISCERICLSFCLFVCFIKVGNELRNILTHLFSTHNSTYAVTLKRIVIGVFNIPLK